MKMTACLAVAAVAVLAGTAFGGIRALRHDPWGGNANSWQMQRHREKLASIAGYPDGGPKVVFIGDSITHFWESYGANQLEKYFSEGALKMLNLGYGGDRTEHLLWRLDEGGELDGYAAKCILLMIGTNNTGHFPVAQEPPADTILGIRAILRLIRQKQPDAAIVLTAIFPRGRDVNDSARRRNETVNREIRSFADGKHIFWCDFNEQFLTRDGLLSPAIFPDRLHPADKGYEIWYSAVKPYIDYALADGKLPVPAHRYAPFQREEGLMMDECVPETPLSGIRWVKNDNWEDPWLDRLEQDRNRIADAKGGFDVVLIGDAVPDSVRKENAGEKTLDLVVNEGLEHLQWRLENGVLDGYQAKKIIFAAGSCSKGWGAENVAKGVKKALATIARKQPKAEVVVLPLQEKK